MLSNPARMAVLDAAVALAASKGIIIEASWGHSQAGARGLRRRRCALRLQVAHAQPHSLVLPPPLLRKRFPCGTVGR